MNKESKKLEHAIIRTLCYAQIFSFPLTFSELWRYLIYSKKTSREELSYTVYKNKDFFHQIEQYVVLPGDSKLIQTRNERTVHSRKKLAKALWISQILSYVPSVRLIGISGSLSMYNAKKDDDIDLFFITSKNSLWLTRFLVNVVLLVLREKRSRMEKYAKDKICPNIFMDEDHLEITDNSKNLYTAHEVAQLKVLYNKGNIYNKFLLKNRWILKYLPNVYDFKKVSFSEERSLAGVKIAKEIIEYFFFKIQYFYMRNKITNEKIGKNIAFFHPLNQGYAVYYLYKLRSKTNRTLFKNLKKEWDRPNFTVLN